MNTLSRKSLIGTFALLASLSAPLVFAQSATTAVSAATPQATAAVQSSTQADPQATAQTAASVQAATPAASVQANTATAATASPVKKSWSDVDGDKDGKLSKAEASVVPALGELFDKADGNADGALTTDEYKTYIAKTKSTSNGGGKGGTSK